MENELKSVSCDVAFKRRGGVELGVVPAEFVGLLSVDGRVLTNEQTAYFIAYGIRQALGDAYADEKDDANCMALVRKKLDGILSGKLGRSGGGSAVHVSLEDRALIETAMAFMKVHHGAQFKALPKAKDDAAGRTKALTEYGQRYFNAPTFKAAYEAALAAMQPVKVIDLDAELAAL